MSRYSIPGTREDHEVVVGWDSPLQSYFAQVTGKRHPADRRKRMLLWVGADRRGELPTTDALAGAVSGYATLTPELIQRLEQDKRGSPPPTRLQTNFV